MSSAGKLLIASALAAVFATACTSTQIAPVSDNSTTGTIKSGPASVPAAPAASSSGAQVVPLSGGSGFSGLFRGQQEVAAAVQYLAGLVLIQNGTADGVDEAIAGAGNAVVEQQPALAGLNGGSTAADLHALPPVGALAHHMAVTAPELHIRALAQEDVTEGSVAAVGRAAEQGVLNIYSLKHGGLSAIEDNT